jgi:uncharacterized zinc-type alcohol dehydrogenase-like protein
MIKAYAAFAAKEPLKAFQYEEPQVGPEDVEIEITHCGLCHSDLHLIDNDWAISNYPLVPGHEIVGKVIKKGSHVRGLELGMRVGISWQCGACLHCEFCTRGEDNLCSNKVRTCVDRFGGFATKIVLHWQYIHPLPDTLPSETAAPLLCAGSTVYSPLRLFGIQAPMSVAIIGIGGLGHLGLQFARAFGCEVTAISSSPDKESEARKFGAHHFLSHKNLSQALSHFDFILSTVHANLDWNLILSLLKPKGRLNIVGLPDQEIKIFPRFLVSGQRSLSGSTVGTRAHIREMIKFAARHHIVAKTELLPMSEINKAIERLRSNKVRYRMVLTN